MGTETNKTGTDPREQADFEAVLRHAFDVSGRSKPATRGRFKTSHF